jgi:hypothetical protein
MPICEVAAEYEPPTPPICLRGALESCLRAYDNGRFDFRWSIRSKISRSTAIFLTEQLKSQLPQVQELVTRRLVPYIVRDGQWQCGIRPTAPSMAHPARRVMPNGPVGRKLQQFKCMSKVACCAFVPNGWCPFGGNIGGF